MRFAEKYKISSTRLTNWDYSIPGHYFISICTINHANLFGKIIDNQMEYTKQGLIASNELNKTTTIRKNIIIYPWVIMPNHVHLLITIRDVPVETPRGASLHDNYVIPPIIPTHKNHPMFYSRLNTKSNQEIPKLINQFKSRVTKICRQNNLLFGWQSRYHDIIIKEKAQLFAIKNYIINNPKNWQKDKYFA